MTASYEVLLAITSYAYVEIEAEDANDALASVSTNWQAYEHDAANAELTGVGVRELDSDDTFQMEPV